MKLLSNTLVALAVLALCVGTPTFAASVTLLDVDLCTSVDYAAPAWVTSQLGSAGPTSGPFAGQPGGGVRSYTSNGPNDVCPTEGTAYPDAPFAFTVPFNGSVTLTVTDQGDVGDVYEVFLQTISLGLTSSVNIGDPTASSGSWTNSLVAADYHYDIADVILSYMGGSSPYGTGTVTSGFSPGTLHVTITEACPVGEPGDDEGCQAENETPEPGSILLLGAGLLGLTSLVRKLRKV
jgi:hypothetical protein